MFQRQLKMALKIGNVFINEDDLIPVIVKASTEIDTYVKGYHVYKNIWKPTVNKELEIEMEPDNVMDKYAVCLKKSTSIVGHLPLGKNGKFAKMIFYFLRADQEAECKVVITDKKLNLGDGERMQVSCKLKFSGPRKMVEILCKNIQCSTKEGKKKLLLYSYLYFDLLSQQSVALNFLIPDVFANSKGLSLSMIPSIGTFWLLFQQTSGKLLYLFVCSSHSVCFFVKKTFLSFPKKLSVCAYFLPM